MTTLAARVKRRRLELGMTQVELADLATQRGPRTVSQQSIHELETGIVLSPRSLPEIANVLQTTIEDLLHGEAATAIPVVGHAIDLRPLDKRPALPLYSTKALAGGGGAMTMTIGPNGKRKTVRTPRMSGGATMVGTTMLPVFRKGDQLLLDSHGTVKAGQDYMFCTAVVEARGRPVREIKTRVGHLVRQTATEWYAKQWCPMQTFRLSRDEYPVAVLITGVYRRG